MDFTNPVLDGDELPGHHTLEGPTLYKRDGRYWIFAPGGGVATGGQSVFPGTPDSQDHVTFGPVSVDLDGVEEVAA